MHIYQQEFKYFNKFYFMTGKGADVAQLAERLTRNEQVVGSNPTISSSII